MEKKGYYKTVIKIFICLNFLFLFFNVSLLKCWGIEKYPNKPITMVIGFSPGGASDLGSKIIADKITEFLGQPILSNYKPGGGGTLAASYVSKAKPDGYTTLVMVSFMYLPPEVKKLDYSLEDFVFTGLWGRAPYFIAVKADSKWKTLKDLIEDAKHSPKKLTFGTAGVTSGGSFVYSLLSKYAGIEMSQVPFKSCGEAMTALMGGHINSYFCVGAGEVQESTLVRILAVAEEKRLEGLDEIPTISELGWPVVFSTWYTFAFPKGTPKVIVDTFAKAQNSAIEKYKNEITQKLNRVHMWPAFGSPDVAVKEFRNQYYVIQQIMKGTNVEKK